MLLYFQVKEDNQEIASMERQYVFILNSTCQVVAPKHCVCIVSFDFHCYFDECITYN